MPKLRWIFGTCCLVLLCLAVTMKNVLGGPVRDSGLNTSELEADRINWTGLADEWLQDQRAVTLLPSNARVHRLPQTADPETSWDVEPEQQGGHLSLFADRAIKLLDIRLVMKEVENSVLSGVTCTACKVGVGLLQHFIRVGKSDQEIVRTIYFFCASLQIQSRRVCRGVTTLFGRDIIYVLKQSNMGSSEICGFLIGEVCNSADSPRHEWEVAFPPIVKPPVQSPISPRDGTPTLKVLHISDTHYDPYYQEGSNAECNEPLCCRQTNGAPRTAAAGAGRWGDYRKCDTPKKTVDHMLSHINHTHSDIDYILWTGDLPPHDIWNQTREENLKVLRETVAQMTEKFPGVPIFPALGNHESAPVNSFPPDFVPKEMDNVSWLYDELDVQWKKWLPAGVSDTVKRGAFYSVLVRPGFRIISVNMNYCNNKNWWLLINSTDPVNELQWLVYELQNAEFNSEKVHIIGHIPPGHSDCLKVWSRNYYKIINRYESTITAQFFGHTHYDEFQLFYDTSDLKRPVSIAYVGPSVSPYFDLNPGYRIYYVDGNHENTTRMVIDHETWVMNLREANIHNYPLWYKMYSAREAYRMSSLLPKDWDILIDKMADDPSIFNLYYKHYYKDSPVRPTCNNDCRRRLLCDLRSGRSHNRKVLCQSLEAKPSLREWLRNPLDLSRLPIVRDIGDIIKLPSPLGHRL